MRDPARIDPAVERLRAVWKANPDLRLGQLVYNAAHAARALTPPCPPLFYMEDAELLDALEPRVVVPEKPVSVCRRWWQHRYYATEVLKESGGFCLFRTVCRKCGRKGTILA